MKPSGTVSPSGLEQSSTTYHYRCLDSSKQEIRLLRLLAYTEDHPIECVLDVASLNDEPPKYVALSYEWGSSPATHSILVNKENFPIKENAYAALRHLRGARDDLTLWVDAICINQSDSYEKSGQVRMMKDIFQRAEKVITWLGPAADGTDELIDLLDEIG